MLTWFVGGIVQDRQLLLRFVVLMLPLVFFFNAQGEAHFARLGHFAFAWWACLLQLIAVLGLLFVSQLFVRRSREQTYTRIPLSIVRVILKCSAAYFVGYLVAIL